MEDPFERKAFKPEDCEEARRNGWQYAAIEGEISGATDLVPMRRLKPGHERKWDGKSAHPLWEDDAQ